MAHYGIDIGSKNIVVASLNNNSRSESFGCDVLMNESSSRLTPTVVSFKGDTRCFGESAQSMLGTNYAGTVTTVNHYLGDIMSQDQINSFSDSSVRPTIKDGRAVYDIDYCSNHIKLDAAQIYAQYLLKSRQIMELNDPLLDNPMVSIAIPSYYGYSQMEAIMDATQAVGLSVTAFVHEHTAVAACYAVDNLRRIRELNSPEYVLFLDVGYSSASATISDATVLSSICDATLGSLNIDRFLAHLIAYRFKEKYHIDPTTNNRSVVKLFKAAERCKKDLSPENVRSIPVNIDFLINDLDFHGIVDRTTLEEGIMTMGFTQRLEHIIQSVLLQSHITIQNVISCEVIGGTMRIPIVKSIVRNILKGMILRTTLNMDECIAKGCAYFSFLSGLPSGNLRIIDPKHPGISTIFPTHRAAEFKRVESYMRSVDITNTKRSNIRNEIESLIIRAVNRLQEIKPDDQNLAKNEFEEIERWLTSDKGNDATIQTLNAKLSQLQGIMNSYFPQGLAGDVSSTSSQASPAGYKASYNSLKRPSVPAAPNQSVPAVSHVRKQKITNKKCPNKSNTSFAKMSESSTKVPSVSVKMPAAAMSPIAFENPLPEKPVPFAVHSPHSAQYPMQMSNGLERIPDPTNYFAPNAPTVALQQFNDQSHYYTQQQLQQQLNYDQSQIYANQQQYGQQQQSLSTQLFCNTSQNPHYPQQDGNPADTFSYFNPSVSSQPCAISNPSLYHVDSHQTLPGSGQGFQSAPTPFLSIPTTPITVQDDYQSSSTATLPSYPTSQTPPPFSGTSAPILPQTNPFFPLRPQAAVPSSFPSTAVISPTPFPGTAMTPPTPFPSTASPPFSNASFSPFPGS